MSLLYCHGIGIFNGVNFATDASGTLFHIGNNRPGERGPGTHAAAWAALSGWADQMDTASVFLKSVQFRGVPLLDSIDAVWPSATGAPLVSRVIENWGIDLREVRRRARIQKRLQLLRSCLQFNAFPTRVPTGAYTINLAQPRTRWSRRLSFSGSLSIAKIDGTYDAGTSEDCLTATPLADGAIDDWLPKYGGLSHKISLSEEKAQMIFLSSRMPRARSRAMSTPWSAGLCCCFGRRRRWFAAAFLDAQFDFGS